MLGGPGQSPQADKGLEAEGGVGTAWLPGGNTQGRSCSEHGCIPLLQAASTRGHHEE